MRVFTAPEPFPPNALGVLPSRGPIVFLAGSIEMGKAEPWQDRVIEGAQDLIGNILNPRRANWDPTWSQEPSNPQFREQVEWELKGLERANLVAMYLDPNTKSPVSLLELGLFAREDPDVSVVIRDFVVCCPPGFWRRGNVQIVCERYGLRMVDTLEDIIQEVRKASMRYSQSA